jgi:D-threo-aldose 1-dehydrogenase
VHEMSRYLALGVFEVILIHNRWTLVDRSAGQLIQQARERGVAVVNAAIYGGGILAQPRHQTTYGYQPATQETLNAVGAMDEVCRQAGTSLAVAALQASVSDPWVDATIVGISKPTRLQQLLAGLSQQLPAELFVRLEELMPSKTNWLDYRQQN